MGTTIYPTVPVAQPAAEPWPPNGIGDDDPIGIQADEMFARQLDTEFAGEIRTLVHDPETGLATKGAEDALASVADAILMLGELKDRYLSQAIGPRQRTILEPLIDSRLDRATGDLGWIAQQATSALDDRIVAERVAGLQQDAALAWHDPAYLRSLGRAAVNELRYQGERRGWDEAQTDTTARTSRQQLDRLLGAFEAVEGKPPTMADIRGLVGDALRPLADDPNVVRAADDESASVDGDVQVAQQREAQNRPPARQQTSSPPGSPVQELGRGYGKRDQAEIEKGMTRDQIRINRDQAFRELARQPLTQEQKARSAPLPDDWEKTKPADIVDEIKRAAERHGVPIQLLARLLYQEGKFNETDKLKRPLVMESSNPKTPIGYAQMTGETFEDLKRRARERGDQDRAKELAGYSLANREQSFDAAAEQLAYLHRLMGGSSPKAVAGYNYGGTGIWKWFDGRNVEISIKKWDELKGYLPFALRGAAEDPQTADGYAERLPNQGRTRDRLYRPNVPSDTQQNS